jgi:hypothetical protein
MTMDIIPLENAIARFEEGLARAVFRKIVERDRGVLQEAAERAMGR